MFYPNGYTPADARERFGEVEYHRGAYSWSCPECSAHYGDAWGGRDTQQRRRDHIAGHILAEAREGVSA